MIQQTAFKIIRNDITKVTADAIVNTANPEVAIGDGVDSAIYEAAGTEKLLGARKKIGRLPIGEAGITSAFQLDAKYIIHASCPPWIDGLHKETALLRQCYDTALHLAYKHHCKTIAFPLLSTGTYGFPKELGLQIALDAFTTFLLKHEMEIILVVFGETDTKLSGNLFENVREYVDNTYVKRTLWKEYRHDSIPTENTRNEVRNIVSPTFLNENRNCPPVFSIFKPNFSSERRSDSEKRTFALEEIADSKEKTTHKTDEIVENEAFFSDKTQIETTKFDNIPKPIIPYNNPAETISEKFGSYEKQTISPYSNSKLNLDITLEDNLFGKYLQQLINKKGMKNAEVYTAANITKQYFSKLLKGKVSPSKTKILSLAVALRLNLDETIDFLCMSGYAFSPFSAVDKIFEYFIRNQIYDIYKIDIVLFDYGLPTLVNE